MTLVHNLVNKQQVFRRIIRIIFLFLEYDFEVMYKPNNKHVVANALSRLSDTRKPLGVPYQTKDVSLFVVQPTWL